MLNTSCVEGRLAWIRTVMSWTTHELLCAPVLVFGDDFLCEAGYISLDGILHFHVLWNYCAFLERARLGVKVAVLDYGLSWAEHIACKRALKEEEVNHTHRLEFPLFSALKRVIVPCGTQMRQRGTSP